MLIKSKKHEDLPLDGEPGSGSSLQDGERDHPAGGVSITAENQSGTVNIRIRINGTTISVTVKDS